MKRCFAMLAAALLATAALPARGQDYDSHGHALVQDSKGWVYIDRDQRPVLRPYIFDNGPDYFEEGLARFVDNGKMGFFDEALNIVIPAKYDFAFPFRDGVAKAGTDCRRFWHGEHSSVQCKTWEYVRKPAR